MHLDHAALRSEDVLVAAVSLLTQAVQHSGDQENDDDDDRLNLSHPQYHELVDQVVAQLTREAPRLLDRIMPLSTYTRLSLVLQQQQHSFSATASQPIHRCEDPNDKQLEEIMKQVIEPAAFVTTVNLQAAPRWAQQVSSLNGGNKSLFVSLFDLLELWYGMNDQRTTGANVNTHNQNDWNIQVVEQVWNMFISSPTSSVERLIRLEFWLRYHRQITRQALVNVPSSAGSLEDEDYRASIDGFFQAICQALGDEENWILCFADATSIVARQISSKTHMCSLVHLWRGVIHANLAQTCMNLILLHHPDQPSKNGRQPQILCLLDILYITFAVEPKTCSSLFAFDLVASGGFSCYFVRAFV